MLRISPSAHISPLADIEDSTRGTLIEIGDQVSIDSFVKIKPAGGTGDLRIGANTTINSGCVFYTGNGIVIGRRCAIAANCTFAPVNHAISDRSVPIIAQGFMPSRGGIRLEDDVWIGANVVVLDGAVLQRGCVVGAGSVVRGEIPPYAICVGAPARVIRYRGSAESELNDVARAGMAAST
jgi:acetyltransferase-like isoleucine patch superfamily enzyme